MDEIVVYEGFIATDGKAIKIRVARIPNNYLPILYMQTAGGEWVPCDLAERVQ